MNRQELILSLLAWLDDECPPGTDTYDLSHDFAYLLRNRLDKINSDAPGESRSVGDDEGQEKVCPVCEGAGKVYSQLPDEEGYYKCWGCDGTGQTG